jgi:hypothetical protein
VGYKYFVGFADWLNLIFQKKPLSIRCYHWAQPKSLDRSAGRILQLVPRQAPVKLELPITSAKKQFLAI